MKTTCCTIICFTALALTSGLAQQFPGQALPQPAMPGMPGMPGQTPGRGGRGERTTDDIPLTRFNLDFPGGTPKELVAAIEKAMGKPLNAIVPKELADTSLPALKMNDVNVAMLFQALVVASSKNVVTPNSGYLPGMPPGSYSTYQSTCGFRTGSGGNPSDNTIWYFYADKPFTPAVTTSPVNNICRFYSLAPYLDRGVSVDDITTAIETGWKMLGEISPPRISFHKETKLLIAVGEERKLDTIDAVLKALEPPRTGMERFGRMGMGTGGRDYPPPVKTNPAVQTPTPAEKPKTEQPPP
ncbi:MAG: hypothetical protein NT154_27695 [Verrucomicrobia bacterium]|nr:hypothetical protein [Verrucomicrobiota bacterium]